MAAKQTLNFEVKKKEFSRAEILESLAYELKPFVLAALGFGGAIYCSRADLALGKYFSMMLMGCSLAILYWRAKDRGVIQ